MGLNAPGHSVQQNVILFLMDRWAVNCGWQGMIYRVSDNVYLTHCCCFTACRDLFSSSTSSAASSALMRICMLIFQIDAGRFPILSCAFWTRKLVQDVLWCHWRPMSKIAVLVEGIRIAVRSLGSDTPRPPPLLQWQQTNMMIGLVTNLPLWRCAEGVGA